MEKGKHIKDKTVWESKLPLFLGGLMKEMRKITFGPEPIISYLLSLKEEVRNIVMIYIGLKMNMDREIIKQQLCTAYV